MKKWLRTCKIRCFVRVVNLKKTRAVRKKVLKFASFFHEKSSQNRQNNREKRCPLQKSMKIRSVDRFWGCTFRPRPVFSRFLGPGRVTKSCLFESLDASVFFSIFGASPKRLQTGPREATGAPQIPPGTPQGTPRGPPGDPQGPFLIDFWSIFLVMF